MRIQKWFCAVMVGFVFVGVAFGQGLIQGPFDERHLQAVLKLLGENKSFSAKTHLTVAGTEGKPTTATFDLRVLDGNYRADVDLANVQADEFVAGMIQLAGQLGLTKSIHIGRLDKKVVYLILPSLGSYAEQKMSEEQAAKADKEVKLEKTELGQEVVETHPCVKSKVVLAEEGGEATEFTVWSATDMQDFPIQVQYTQGGSKITVKFTGVTFAKPDAALFELPKGLTKYGTVQELMTDVINKLMPGMVPEGGKGGEK